MFKTKNKNNCWGVLYLKFQLDAFAVLQNKDFI